MASQEAKTGGTEKWRVRCRPIAERVKAARLRLGFRNVPITETEIGFGGQSRKALLLLLCARIGYTPPAGFPR
jgi:hypothetical protein